MKQLHIISCFPDDNYFLFEVETYLTNLRKHNLSSKFRGLVLIPHDRKTLNPLWLQLQDKFKESQFFFYKDEDGTLATHIKAINYIPLLRPWLLKKHFEEFPELENDCIMYTDSDIALTDTFNIDHLIQDETCYLSDISSYLNKEYVDSKVQVVEVNKLEQFKTFDVLDNMGKICGINREIIEKNNLNTGGAQYILKGINKDFWQNVYNSCLSMRPYLASLNQFFMKGSSPNEKENNGYQSWCTDLFVVLYTLWRTNKETKTVKELDFAWATDPISKIKEVGIFHNAGASSEIMELNGVKETIFFKSKLAYRNNILSPFSEKNYLDSITDKYCTYFYTQCIKEVKEPIFK